MDIDHFKAFNDAYGHTAGDACIRQVARALHAAVRTATDVVCRYGGEEFGAILAGAPLADALRVAERLREAVRTLAIAHGSSLTAPVVTLSIGVAAIEPTRDADPQAVVDTADRALYQAKGAGRDRVQHRAVAA